MSLKYNNIHKDFSKLKAFVLTLWHSLKTANFTARWAQSLTLVLETNLSHLLQSQ